MMLSKRQPGRWLAAVVAAAVIAVTQVPAALAQPPQPNPLAPLVAGGNPIFSPILGANLAANGAAATMHGDPTAGRELFAHICITCHGDRGTGGVLNPGSDDGTVPTLNPIDPGFLDGIQGDPSTFAHELDFFVQHGSRPAGPNPALSMIPWGDAQLLSQPDLANAEAYVMQLNGVYWPDRWSPPAEVRMEAARVGSRVTYRITLVNHGSSALGNLQLRDSLPPGLAYVSSGVPGLGDNPGKVSANTVGWINLTGVPRGGTLGPFVIVAEAADATTPTNVAQLFFTWSTWDGSTYSSSAVSSPTLPGPARVVPHFSLTPVPSDS
jgi:uncharacterized repeat protein (TIGR01451 family)